MRHSIYGGALYGGRAKARPGSDLLSDLHALLLAQQRNYWSTHQQASGPSFYGDHLLFERLYTGLTEQIDGLAERMVTMYGPAVVGNVDVTSRMASWLESWNRHTDPVGRAMRSETDFATAVRQAYDGLKASGELTLGMDDFLMGLASEHDQNLYLLKQRAS
jgi:DNA-binding ferritin-like protein